MRFHNFNQQLANIQYFLADRVLDEDCFSKLDRVAGQMFHFQLIIKQLLR